MDTDKHDSQILLIWERFNGRHVLRYWFGYAGLPIHFPLGVTAHLYWHWVKSAFPKVFAAYRENYHPFWGDHQSRGGPREICSVCFIHLLESTGYGKVHLQHAVSHRDILCCLDMAQSNTMDANLPSVCSCWSIHHLSVTALLWVIWQKLHHASVWYIYLFPLRAEAISHDALHRYVFYLQPSLYGKKRHPPRIFCQTEENVRQPVAQGTRWADGLNCSEYNTGPLLEKKNIELDWSPPWRHVPKLLGFEKRIPSRCSVHCFTRAVGVIQATFIMSRLWVSPCDVSENRLHGANPIDLRNQLIHFCNSN